MRAPNHNTTLCAYFAACDERALLVQSPKPPDRVWVAAVERAEKKCRDTLAAYDAAQEKMRKIDAWEEANAIG